MGVAASTFFNWSAENIATLTKLWNDGHSAGEIVKVFNGRVSRSAVIGKVHRLGLTGRSIIAQHHRSRPIAATRSVVRPTKAKPPAPKPVGPPVEAAEPLPDIDELYPTASLMTLGAGMCKWPIGDPRDEGFGFCGRLRPREAQYCPAHAARNGRRPAKHSAPKDLERSLRRYL
jgi:GcrA cell cycle regulator